MAEAAALAARPRRLVISLHNDYVRPRTLRRLWWPVHRATLRSARRVITSSQEYAATSSALRGLRRDALAYIPYGVDLVAWARPHPDAPTVRAAYPTPLVVFLGRLCYYKGLEVLIEAARSVPATFLILGDGPWRGRLERQADGLRNVDFLGALGESEAVAHVQAADVFAFPSTARSEAFGLSQLKAMAGGLPVVSSTLPGVAWLNRTGETGLTVPPGDAAALADALTHLLDNPDLRQRFALGARRRAAEFSSERMRMAHQDLYAACLASQ
jgi:rhamnosyl/mannosyltransferase